MGVEPRTAAGTGVTKTLFTDTGDGYLRSGTVRFFEALRPLMVPIDSVQPHPENNNNGDEDLVEASVLINGMYRALQVQASTGYIAAGNTTWAVCKRLGSLCIPVVPMPINDIETLRVLSVDNESARQAVRDEGLTVDMMRKIAESEGDLAGTGITMEQLEQMEARASVPLDLAPDPYEGWPTLSAVVSPEMFEAFMDFTSDADDDGNRGRIELLMHLAGWRPVEGTPIGEDYR